MQGKRFFQAHDDMNIPLTNKKQSPVAEVFEDKPKINQRKTEQPCQCMSSASRHLQILWNWEDGQISSVDLS